jgi:hypothetical protein
VEERKEKFKVKHIQKVRGEKEKQTSSLTKK